MSKGYHWFYRNYWWLLLMLFAATVGAPMLFGAGGQSPVLMMLLIGNIALAYFIQKQRLTTLKISTELTLHFNGRYAALRSELYRILEGDTSEELSTGQIDVLHAYFDLCAEEYSLFRQELIPPETWASWLEGMRGHYYNSRIRRHWENALMRRSYYGFDSRLLK